KMPDLARLFLVRVRCMNGPGELRKRREDLVVGEHFPPDRSLLCRQQRRMRQADRREPFQLDQLVALIDRGSVFAETERDRRSCGLAAPRPEQLSGEVAQ